MVSVTAAVTAAAALRMLRGCNGRRLVDVKGVQMNSLHGVSHEGHWNGRVMRIESRYCNWRRGTKIRSTSIELQVSAIGCAVEDQLSLM